MSARRRSGPPRELLDDQGRPIHVRIRQLRTEKGLAASELARRADISPAYVTRIEKGEKVPGEEVALKLAKILGDDPELYLWWVHGRFISDPESTLSGFRKVRTPETSARPPAVHSVAFLSRDPREPEYEDEKNRERARERLSLEIEKHDEILRNLSDQRERLEHEVERQERMLERISPRRQLPRKLAQMARLSRRFDLRVSKKKAGKPAPFVAEDAEAIMDYRVDGAGAMLEEPTKASLDFQAGGSAPVRVRLYDNAASAGQAPEWMWLDSTLLPEHVDMAKVVAHRLSEEDAAHLGDLVAGDVAVVVRGFDDPPDPDRIYLVAAPEASRFPTRLSRLRVKENRLILISEGERSDVEILELSQERTLSHWLLGTVVVVIRCGD